MVIEVASVLREGGLLFRKKFGALLLKTLVSLLLLLYLASRVSLDEIEQSFARADWSWLLGGLSCMVAGVVVSSWKWRALLLADNVDCPLRVLCKIYFIGIFFNNFLPTSIGGDAIRGYYLSRHWGSKSVCVSSILMERISGFLVLVLFPFLGLMLSPWGGGNNVSVPLAVLLAFSVILLGCFIASSFRNRLCLFLPIRMATIIVKLSEAFVRYFRNSRARISMIIGSVFFNGLVFTTYWCVAQALHIDLKFATLMIVVPVVAIFSLLPVSLNGLGLREVSFVFFLTDFGVGRADALSFSLHSYVLLLIISLLGGLVYCCGKFR